MTESNEIFIAYEAWNVEEACSQATRGTTVVCLDFWVERELKKKNISYVSLRDIIDAETGIEEWLLLAQKIAREWYRLPAMKFFEYGGIRIGEVPEPIMEEYLSKLFYYVRIYGALKKEYPNLHLHIPVLVAEDTPTTSCLASFERRAVVDAARVAGIKNIVQGKFIQSHDHSFLRTAWKSLLVHAYNIFISVVPHRSLKIYASEYWSHIGSAIEQMDDVELVLMGSGELKKISWRQLIKHRVRIRHPDDAICGVQRNATMQISEEFLEQWKDAKKEVAAFLTHERGGFDWSPVLEACEYLMTYASRVVSDIDALHHIMEKEKPDIVLQLASVAGRHHYFFIMSRIAAQFKIPSIELQHGVNSIDPRTVYSRFETDYLATYGTDTNSWLQRMGRPHNQLIPIGSPRFDRYSNERPQAIEKGKQLLKQLGLDTKRPILLASVPFSGENLVFFNSYQLAEFFEAIRAAQNKIPGIQILFKFRHYKYVGAAREYLQELFPSDSAIAGNEDLFALLCASDAVVCGFSTVIYETMLTRKPLVLYPWQVFDTYNAQMYTHAAPFAHSASEVADILARIFSDAAYHRELLVRQEHFLEGYLFDGKSSERLATLLKQPLKSFPH